MGTIEPLLTPEQVCQTLGGISRNRFYELIKSRPFPIVYVGKRIRVQPEDLRKWLNNGSRAIVGHTPKVSPERRH